MPKPSDGESKRDFIKRCIPKVLFDGTASSSEQAYAVCLSMWERKEFNYLDWNLFIKSPEYLKHWLESNL